MNKDHTLILNLGSNIDPAANIRTAIALLGGHGLVQKVSTAWESRAVGGKGANYLNASVSLRTPLEYLETISKIVDPIEAALGRTRNGDKFASRTIDLDIILFDGQPHHLDTWQEPFLVVPTAELLPDITHPLTREKISTVAERMLAGVWMVPHPEIILI